jgi:hypothetical protein
MAWLLSLEGSLDKFGHTTILFGLQKLSARLGCSDYRDGMAAQPIEGSLVKLITLLSFGSQKPSAKLGCSNLQPCMA